MTSRQYGKRAIFVQTTSDFKMAAPLIYANWGGGTLSSDFFFLSMSALAQVHVVIMYTHNTTVLLWCSGLCDIRVLFLYNVCQYAWRIASIRFNNVSLCPLILIPNVRPAVSALIKPGQSVCQLDAR